MSATLESPVLPPRSIVLDPPLSDEEFERLCDQTSLAFLERTKEGTIRMNAPAGGTTSSGNAEITRQLSNWWIQHAQGDAPQIENGKTLSGSEPVEGFVLDAEEVWRCHE
jgi:Uma2 family endonuclease